MSAPTNEPRRWRPVSTADLRTIEQAVMRSIDAWLQEWVAEPCAASTRIELIDQAACTEPFMRDRAWSLGASVRFASRPAVWDALLRRVLGLPIGASLAEDRLLTSLLDPVRNDLQSDLLQRLTDALALRPALPMPLLRAYAPEEQAQEKIQLTCLLDDQQPLFDLRMAETWRWLTIPASPLSKAAKPLDRRHHALADTRLTVAALLGRCELSLTELGGLAAGDVITTRQPLSKPLDMVMFDTNNHPGRVFAHGQPGLTQGKASMQITFIPEKSP